MIINDYYHSFLVMKPRIRQILEGWREGDTTLNVEGNSTVDFLSKTHGIKQGLKIQSTC